jgi:predicted DsbA family dithiol-disulfide isomerase
MKIDFVSDVSCPWCAIGLANLERAIAALQGEVKVNVRCQPFELNPRMPPGGQDISEHLTQKYGSTPEQQAQIRATIRQRGADAGFEFNAEGRGRIYNTFDAHRLLHWAGEAAPDKQLPLKKALLVACHRDQQAMDDHAVLLACARQAGLDAAQAAQVLANGDFADAVREREALYTSSGIHAVPAVVINEHYLVSGGQPQAMYEQVLRQVVAEGC